MDFSGILYIDAEKISHKGEDASVSKFDQSGNGYIFVFDGCGGAGSETHASLEHQKSAYLASRSCALFFEKYFRTLDFSDTETVSRLLYEYLEKINHCYPMTYSESTLVDILPTTLSGAVIRTEQEDISVQFLWAGDSRGYVLDKDGLAQVTEDDVNSEDAYQNLSDDAIMTNRIHGNSSKPLFQIHSAEITLHKKGIIFCATDGCYDYFKSPMIFEFLIVMVLYYSTSFSQAEQQLLKILNENSGDDCSLTAVFYGFSDYDEIRKFVEKRFADLNQDKTSFDKDYWNQGYKQNYYRYNPLRSEQNAGTEH